MPRKFPESLLFHQTPTPSQPSLSLYALHATLARGVDNPTVFSNSWPISVSRSHAVWNLCIHRSWILPDPVTGTEPNELEIYALTSARFLTLTYNSRHIEIFDPRARIIRTLPDPFRFLDNYDTFSPSDCVVLRRQNLEDYADYIASMREVWDAPPPPLT